MNSFNKSKKTVAYGIDIDMLHAYRNRNCWPAFKRYQHWWHWM